MLAEQAGGERLAGAGRPVEQARITRPQLLAHLPLLEKLRPVLDPLADLVELFERRRGEDEVVPALPGLDEPRRELAAERRSPLHAGSEAMEAVAREREQAVQRWLARRGRREVEDVPAREEPVAVEQAHGFEPRGERVTGEEEGGGLPGGEESRVLRRRRASELRE